MNPWSGWRKQTPNKKERLIMFQKCGKKCFLRKLSYPICKKNTCKISKKGVWAAYIRSRQTKSNSITKKAKRFLK